MPRLTRSSALHRILLPPAPLPANSNIHRRYAIEHAHWVWHPDLPPQETAHVLFERTIRLRQTTTCTLHVSADQRHILRLNGAVIARGPHRSDLQHWSFESYRLRLPAGTHRFAATVWWLAHGLAPFAQVTWRGGFVLHAEGLPAELLDTGVAAWTARELRGVSFRPPLQHTFHVVGPGYDFDGPRWLAPGPARPVVALAKPWHINGDWYGNGTIRRDWALHPSPLPSLVAIKRRLGVVRAIARGRPPSADERFPALSPADAPTVRSIERMLAGRGVWRVPARSRMRVVIDLDDYYCAYPTLRLTGRGTVTLLWAESLYETATDYGKVMEKGNRDQVVGKFFHGFGDTFRHDGRTADYSPPWWRAGRYWLLEIETGAKPLTIAGISLEETRFPLERVDRFACDRVHWRRLDRILWRGIATGAHEIFYDSPYYEQMMYVGDSRTEALCHYVCAGDDRLARRGIELFDWSRWRTGFIAERYPSDPFQLSLTFSTLWVGMVRDFAWWRDDAEFVRARLPGIRALLEQFLPLRDARGLLARLPGWSFVDWVGAWNRGMPPGERGDGSASVNLHFLLMLQQVADLESHFGEAMLAKRAAAFATETASAIRSVFWDDCRGLLAENSTHDAWSEHAQVLALLAGLLPAAQSRRALRGLLTAPDLARCSIYFSHYWLEAMRIAGREAEIIRKLEGWEQLPGQGFRTPPERLEDTRSDNHAWSSHPLFHRHATLAGIRPSAPGFRSIDIAPAPGPLQHIACRVPHPAGTLELTLEFQDGSLAGEVVIPPSTEARLRWGGKTMALRAGHNRVAMA